MTQNEFYKIFIIEKIKAKTQNQNSYNLSFCNFDYDIIQNFEFEDYDDTHVVILRDNDYSSAVKLRNNPKVKKIVILSAMGIQNIDSLKDFNEYDLFDAEQDMEIISEIVLKNMSVIMDNKSFIVLKEVIIEQNIQLFQLFNFFVKVSEKTSNLDMQALSNNLCFLNCWNTNSDSKVEIKKVINNSSIDVIESAIEKFCRANTDISPQVKTIKKYLDENKILEMFSRFKYEDIKDLFSSTARNGVKVKRKSSELEEDQSVFALERIFDKNAASYDVREEESGIFYSEFLTINKDTLLMPFQQIHKNVLKIVGEKFCEDVNKKFNKIYTAINSIAQEDFYVYPIELAQFVSIYNNFAKAYVDLLRYMLKTTAIAHKLCEEECLIELLNVYAVKDGDNLVLPYYHPISIIRFIMASNMEYDDIWNANEIYETISDSIRCSLIEQYPVRHLLHDKNFYQPKSDDEPTWLYTVFEKVEPFMGKDDVDFRIIGKEIESYIELYPYKAIVSVNVVGNISISNIDYISALINKKGQMCHKLYINLFCSSSADLRKRLASFQQTGNYSENIVFRIVNMTAEETNVFEIIKKDCDLVIFADCNALYSRFEYVNMFAAPNWEKYLFETQSFDELVSLKTDKENSFFTILFDSLQNVFLTGDNSPVMRIGSKLNFKLLNKIKRECAEEKLFISIVTKDEAQILSGISEIRYSIVHYNGFSCLRLNHKLSVKKIEDQRNNPICFFVLFEFFEELYADNYDFNRFLEKLPIDKNQLMNVAIVFEKSELCVEKTIVCCGEMPAEDVEFMHGFMDDILDSAFWHEDIIGNFIKKIIVNLCYASVQTYNDLLLVYYLEHNFGGVDIIDILDVSEKHINISRGDVVNFTYWKAILDILEKANSMTPKVCADVYQIATRGDLQSLCDSIEDEKKPLKKKLKYILEEGRNE